MVDKFNELNIELRRLRKKFELLVEPHRPALWQYCKLMTGNPWDAEDLVQETLMKTYASLSQLVQPVIPKSYLFRIATNTWLNQCRKQNRIVLREDAVEEVEDTDPFVVREAIERLVINLSPRQRVVVILFDVFGFTSKEVAQMTGTTEGAVKALLHRARANLHRSPDNEIKEDNVRLTEEENLIVGAFLEAFNMRDPDAIARLMDENVLNDIVHVSKEYGIDIVRNHSLEGWALDPMPMTASFKILWGKPVVVVIGRIGEREEVIYDLIELEIENGLIVKKKDYYFCQDLLEAAGAELNLPVHSNGYIYRGKDDE